MRINTSKFSSSGNQKQIKTNQKKKKKWNISRETQKETFVLFSEKALRSDFSFSFGADNGRLLDGGEWHLAKQTCSSHKVIENRMLINALYS